jgi:hypothetical protein
MIYFPDYQKATNSFKLDMIERYLKQLVEFGYVQFTPATKMLFLWLWYVFKCRDESIPDYLESKIFTSRESGSPVTAKVCDNEASSLLYKLEMVLPLRGFSLSDSSMGRFGFDLMVYRTVAAILAALYPMKWRLDRDDITQHTIESEIDELYTLLRFQGHLTADNLKSVAKAVFYHYQVVPELGSNRGAVQGRVCNWRSTIDDMSDEIETLATRYDQLPPRFEEGFS